MKIKDQKKKNDTIIKRFDFDLNVGRLNSMNVLGSRVYSFKFHKDRDYLKLKAFKNILRKLGYLITDFYDISQVPIGISINTTSKRAWLYVHEGSPSRIIDSKYSNVFEDMNYHLAKFMQIKEKQPELFKDFASSKINEIPDYVLEYKLTLWDRIVSWLMK